jgi:NAD(P)-dependent dehydrogenase (short-subunit alcohol dehydrogenase family)
LLLPCDATDTTSLAAARADLLAAWAGVDLVVYLAGDYVPMRADNFDLASPSASSQSISTVPCASPRRSCRTCRSGGGIAFVASVAGYRGLPKALAYGPGKAALIHFAECLHLDLAPQGHRRLGDQPRLRRNANSPPRTISPCPPCKPRAGGNCYGRRL